MSNEKIITIYTFTFAHEVAIVRGRLESEGIACFAQDELTLQVSPFYSNAIGGIKLQVLERDVPRAVEILKEAGYLNDDNESAPEIKKEKREAKMVGTEAYCPFCGSEEIMVRKEGGWLFLVTSLPFLLLSCLPTASPFLKKKYYCFDCQQNVTVEKTNKRI